MDLPLLTDAANLTEKLWTEYLAIMLYHIMTTVVLFGWFAALTLLVAWVFVGMFMSHRNRPWWRWAADRRAWIILGVLGAGLLLERSASIEPPWMRRTYRDSSGWVDLPMRCMKVLWN